MHFYYVDEKENVVKKQKIYTKPELAFVTIAVTDIITTSPTDEEWNDENAKDDGWL